MEERDLEIELYDDLMALVESKVGLFYFKDVVSPFGTKYRIFDYYGLILPEVWSIKGALECRGVMFLMNEDDKPICIASRPMEKFFNSGETVFDYDLENDPIDYVMTKEDGSLISSYIDGNRIGFKSKGSLESTQAIEATQFMLDINNKDLRDRVIEYALDGYTCNFEYVSPENRIVLIYPQRNMILLNVRHNETGEYVPYKELFRDPVFRKYLVEVFSIDGDPYEWIEEVTWTPDIEGFVAVQESGRRFKVKSEWYVVLHSTKETVNSASDLFQTIIDGSSDDLKSLFGDEYSLTKIKTFEKVYFDFLQKSVDRIIEVLGTLRGLDRKTFSDKAQIMLQNSNEDILYYHVMRLFAYPLDYDKLVTELNVSFMKRYKDFIPNEYK